MNLSRTVRIALLATAMLGIAGCTDEADLSETNQDVVSTNLSAYTSGTNIVVTYDGMQGASSDMIAIAHPSDPASRYELLQLTGGGTSGSKTFDSTQLGAGTYEARAYYNWYGTHTYIIQQTSPSFTVTGGPALAASQASYPTGTPVVINYTGFTGLTTDWVAINRVGTIDDNYAAFQYTTLGGASGSLTFNGLALGTYEARYHHKNTTATYATSPQFTIGSAPPATTITTDFSTYSSSQTINTTYANMPVVGGEYVAVSLAGSGAGSFIQRFFTTQANGTQAFSPLAAGNYEARAYSSTNTILATRAFSVTSTVVTTNQSIYTLGQSVTVTFSGVPTVATAYIAISLAGSPNGAIVQYQSTNSAASGTKVFSGLPVGTYEARAYSSSYVVVGRSTPFDVGGSCTVPPVSPVLSGVVSGDLVLDALSFEGTAALSVPLASSILFTSIRESEPSPKFGDTLCELQAAGVYCKRDRPGTDSMSSTGTITIHYTVATFTSGVTVQRGRVDTFTTNPALITLTAVDPTNSFVVLGGSSITGGGWGDNEFTRGRLVNGTTLEIAHATAGSVVSWQVVSMIGASVTRGTTTLASAATLSTVTVPAAPSGSLLLASYTTDNPSGIAAASLMLQSRLASATQLSFQRAQGGSNLSVSWELVALPFNTISGVSSLGAGVASTSPSVPGIAAATSVALSSTQSILGQSTGSSTYTGPDLDLVGESAFTMATGAGALTLTRQSSVASATIPWTVIDFAHNCAGN